MNFSSREENMTYKPDESSAFFFFNHFNEITLHLLPAHFTSQDFPKVPSIHSVLVYNASMNFSFVFGISSESGPSTLLESSGRQKHPEENYINVSATQAFFAMTMHRKKIVKINNFHVAFSQRKFRQVGK
uniref:Uncharacterized protein n=1 Tax=Glypta fumiferanae TaxID=389681 RepID=A0A0F6Q8E4_9HYME|nr:hypothetical protein [Glypta fumiferanae]